MSETSESGNYIVGRHPVIEAMSADSPLEKIFIVYGADDSQIHRIRALADRKRIPCSTVDKTKFSVLERTIGIERNEAQGVIALRSARQAYSLNNLLDEALAVSANPLIVVLDGITDPHNLGAIARSAEAAGAFGLVMPQRYSAPITAVVIKSSAGAIEHLKIARVPRVSEALKECKRLGWTILGTGSPGTSPYTDAVEAGPIILVIGDEGTGLHSSVRNICNRILEIPLKGRVASLNASVAAGIILFHLAHHRN
jgi:23S rRNA (guanosine2251-2'-O)-methyltransferase